MQADTAKRSPFTIEVKLNHEERKFYDAVDDFVRWQHSQRKGTGEISIFAVIIRERQAASCIQALKAHFERSLKSSSIGLDLEMTDPDIREDDVSARQLTGTDRQQVTELLGLCENLGSQDTKYDEFKKALSHLFDDDPSCKVLVFSFFRGTAQYLFDRLTREGLAVETIHGQISLEERQRRIDAFRDRSDLKIMVSTEVGAEGLDFEFCGAMFNYDLPWNPMRVEQRIGRLDRFGQQHKRIRIYNLVIEDTIETRILERLYNRIGLFESSIGDLEPILGKVVSRLSRDIFLARLTAEEERLKVENAVRILERHRQEQKAFESEQGLFLGQDFLLQRDIEEIRSSGRFVSAQEVSALVETFLADALPHVHLDQSEDGRTFYVYPRSELANYFVKSARASQRNRALNEQFLKRLQSEPRLVTLTFDAETAKRRNIEFVTLHHPLAQAALAHFRKTGGRRIPKTALWIDRSSETPHGDFAFFLYRFDIHSATPQCTLVPILVSTDDSDPQPFHSKVFLKELPSDQGDRKPEVEIEEGRFLQLQDAADNYASSVRQDKEVSERQYNDALIDVRIASLDRHFSSHIENLRRQLMPITEERIKRMRQSQIRNSRRRRDERIEEEESKRGVRVEYTMIAAGLARVIQD